MGAPEDSFKHLDPTIWLLRTQCSDSFIPFMHLVAKDQGHTLLEECGESILTIQATLFANQLMKLLKLSDMVPSRKHGR